jgi:alkylation response protein AidB-like acyl-CoA dehydrogenase
MTRKRPCQICRKWFQPHSRAGPRQRACGAEPCQQERHRRACEQWRERHPDYDREERFPQEALDGLKTTGFVGMTIPEAYGGGGADPLTYCLFIEELSRGDANVRSIMSVHLGLVAGSIDRWGSEGRSSSGCRGWPPARCSAASA